MKSGSKLIFLLIPLVLAIQTLTMPNDIAGDGNAIRKVSTWLAQTGEWGLPYAQRPNLGRYLENRNQWFIENDGRQRFYSRWGEMNTLLYAVTEKLRGAIGIEITEDQLIYTNGLNIFFSGLLALYLILIARSLGAGLWATAAVVLTIIYATFTWHYLRMQTYEVFQITFFTAFVFHFFRFIQIRSLLHLSCAMAALLFAAHVKTIFFIFFPCAALIVWRMKLKKAPRLLAGGVLAGGFALALATHLLLATIKMGHFSLSGDAPPPEGWVSDFGFHYIPERLKDYFFGIKTSFFLYFPQLAVAAFAWPAFHRKFRLESQFLLSCLAVASLTLFTFCTYGEWCYGPRYWAFLLPALMIPVLPALMDAKLKGMFFAALLVLAVPMVFLQVQFNSRPFFMRHNLMGFLTNTEPQSPRGLDYLMKQHDAVVALQFNRFLKGRDEYPLLQDLAAAIPPDRTPEMRAELRQMLGQQFACNFYFRILCD